MDDIESNMDWLKEQLQPLIAGQQMHQLSFLDNCCAEPGARIAHLRSCRRNVAGAVIDRWIVSVVSAEDCYLLFDCPGQVELFTLHDALNKILRVMTDDWHLR